MLDSRLPSRLLGAFPAGVEIQRTGLAEAVAAALDDKASAARGIPAAAF
jgi:hypothetical protein